MVVSLFNLSLRYVESLYKIFHVATLQTSIIENSSYPQQATDAPFHCALRGSVFFAEMDAMQDQEYLDLYDIPLDQLVSQSKHFSSQAFERLGPRRWPTRPGRDQLEHVSLLASRGRWKTW